MTRPATAETAKTRGQRAIKAPRSQREILRQISVMGPNRHGQDRFPGVYAARLDLFCSQSETQPLANAPARFLWRNMPSSGII